MNIYLITQKQVSGYDTFDSAVVCAKSAGDAKLIHPAAWVDDALNLNGEWNSSAWCHSPKLVETKLLGIARYGIKRGVICASFNAG